MIGNFQMLVSPTGCWSHGPSHYVQRESASYIAASTRAQISLTQRARSIGLRQYRDLPRDYVAQVQVHLSRKLSYTTWEGLSEIHMAALVLAFHNHCLEN